MGQICRVDVDERLVSHIAALGAASLPNECCGIALPSPLPYLPLVIELDNLSPTPDKAFEVTSHELFSSELFQSWACDELPDHPTPPIDQLAQILVWHTHPSGFVGPSKADLAERDRIRADLGAKHAEAIGFLVVSLPTDSHPYASPTASRY